MEPLFFDFESYSESKIKSTGAARYVRDPSTETLIITWAYREGPVACHDIANDGPLPFQLVQNLMDPRYTKIAANIPFDRGLLKEKHQIILPWDQCMDSHTLAYSLGFSGGLGAIGEQIGLADDKLKIKEGRKLILHFCKPQPPSHNVPRWTKENDPEGWEKFKAYGIRDTESMREMWMLLEPYDSISEKEWHYWQLTQEMNERGMPVDPALVDRAIDMSTQRKSEIKKDLIKLTGLANPNSGQQLLPWLLLMHGVKLPNLQAATVDNALDGGMLGTLCHEVLQKKRTISQTAVTKWNSIQKMLCPDNTLKGMFTHMGASRTQRDASRGVNLQNLRHPPKGNMDTLIKYLYYGDLGLLNMVMGEPLDFLARTVRAAITAPAGKMLVVSDLSSIESRVLGWLTNCTRMNNIFAANMDTYKDFAMELFHRDYSDVTKFQRNFSKPPVLGAGYMMGGKGLAAYAANMGVEMTQDEAQHAVDTFREIYPEIPSFWRWLMKATEYTLTSGKPSSGYRLTLYKQDDFLFIRLPSGRNISYFQPIWQMWDTPIGDKMSFTYMGINRFKSKPTWERIAAHAGGVTENIIQALARDILFEWVDRCTGLHIVARIHDEFISVVDGEIAPGVLDYVNAQAAVPIDWAPGLLLKAEGFITKHYTKD